VRVSRRHHLRRPFPRRQKTRAGHAIDQRARDLSRTVERRSDGGQGTTQNARRRNRKLRGTILRGKIGRIRMHAAEIGKTHHCLLAGGQNRRKLSGECGSSASSPQAIADRVLLTNIHIRSCQKYYDQRVDLSGFSGVKEDSGLMEIVLDVLTLMTRLKEGSRDGVGGRSSRVKISGRGTRGCLCCDFVLLRSWVLEVGLRFPTWDRMIRFCFSVR
jgi:hypothetical protein